MVKRLPETYLEVKTNAAGQGEMISGPNADQGGRTSVRLDPVTDVDVETRTDISIV